MAAEMVARRGEVQRLTENLDEAHDEAYQLEYELDEMTATSNELQQSLNAKVG